MVLERFREPLAAREFDIPTLEPGQTLVRMDASGICGSDVHQWNGEDPRIPLPLILGHEGVGTVADVAGRVHTVDGARVSPGDRIAWNRGIACGRCWFCTVAREPSLCASRRVYGITMPVTEPPHLNGCYADHIILRDGTDIFRVDSGIDPAAIVPATCSGATAAHAFDALGGSIAGATVVVLGPGPLGLFAVAFARRLGASRVIAVGGSENRLAMCGRFGADTLVNRRETTPGERRAEVLDMTSGRGADVVVEATGAQGAALEGIRLLRRGGTFLSAGYSQPAGEESVDFFSDIVSKNAVVKGIWVSDASHLAKSLALVEREPELFGSMVTGRYTLDEADEALGAVERREVVKAVIEFGA